MMSQSDFNEILLPKPEYPEAWECCGSECGDYCVYEIYRRDKIDYDAQQKRNAYNQIWGRGEIGRRTGFRFQRREV